MVKNKNTDYWGTPCEIKTLIKNVLGEINIDPCAEDLLTKNIWANQYFTVKTDGLTKDWVGKIYMNPPYSNPAPWVEKFFFEYEKGNMKEGIGLLPASTDTRWFGEVWKRSRAICFWYGRIKFLDILDGYEEKYPAAKGSVFVYCGSDEQKFNQIFCPFGEIISRNKIIMPINHSQKWPRRKGNEITSAKLTEKDVRAIRRCLYTPSKELADYYKVSVTTIDRVKARKSWKHVK
ncbi:DNA N-6-adenine-methyltransferase [Okeania sp. SIO2B3]|uniref:DNA N-6-adenine-methyltransferase n=1 Tax=Okeania sp. SIO2B3 TaxID=2607784 RepID=UPI0025FEA825|nr:DNA N-6-adenine-methyltransferase [Okeania sp. SIO2B3]